MSKIIQTYSIVLWRKAEKEEITFDDIARRAYDSLDILQKYDVIFRPNFLTAKSKKKVLAFEWNYASFSQNLQNGIMKIGKEEISQLGYSISFCSSLNENESCGILVKVGNRDSRFYNSIVINLPTCVNYCEKSNSDIIKELFTELVNCFEPFWGCISSNQLDIEGLAYMNNNNPLYVHWMNYWSREVALTINKKFYEEIKRITGIAYKGGFLQLSDNVLSSKNEKDLALFKTVNDIYLAD